MNIIYKYLSLIKKLFIFLTSIFMLSVKIIVVTLAIGGATYIIFPNIVLEPMRYISYHIPLYKKIDNAYDVKTIYFNILKVMPEEQTRNLKLVIMNSDIINAYSAPNGTLIITTGIIKALNNDEDAIAFILGHEIAHYVLKHHGAEDNPLQEVTSDQYGMFLSQAAGYDGCKVVHFWKKLLKRDGSTMDSTSHPSTSYRTYYISNICKERRWGI